MRLTKTKNMAVTGNNFRRSGKVGTEGKRSHLLIANDVRGVTFTGNTFSWRGDDQTGENERPKHIIETQGASTSHVIWCGNDTLDGCLEAPIIDRWNNSDDWLDADQFECPAEYYTRFYRTLGRALMDETVCRVRTR